MRKSSKISLKTSAIYIGLVFYICLFVLMKVFAIRTVNETRSVPYYETSLDLIVIVGSAHGSWPINIELAYT